MNKNTLLVLTSYPPKDALYGKNVSGLASFAKNTVHSIKNSFNIIVLAEKASPNSNYFEHNILIKRVWKRNSLFLNFQILKELIRYRKVSNKFLIEFEYAIFGSPFKTASLLISFMISKLLGYKNTVVLHQVINNFNPIALNLGIRNNGIKSSIINFLMTLFNKVLFSLSHKIIVLDKIHKEKLKNLAYKVVVIPHGVEQKEIIKEEVRPKNIIRLLCFGYIAWYKGTDWLVKSYIDFCNSHPKESQKIQLIIAGGESPTQKDTAQYRKYYNEIVELAKQSKNIVITGFIREEDFDKLFTESDIQILPYRTIMSSSGPLSLAFTYEKPFLISDKLQPYFETTDIKKILSKTGIKSDELIFDIKNPIELFKRILKLDQTDKEKLSNFSKLVKEGRKWENLGLLYAKTINDD